ncbi:IS701 family transposase [Streptomyces sp.]|uniref:IS701 family transposase n=1 Tax=Streptomyces sp. TaxID=1931 RepID=UPI002D4B2B10|nr:transposase [Streptomyces sp.]HZF92298.1 transposase [Streptomyces sp.]
MVTTCPRGSSVARTGWSLTDFVHTVFGSLPRVDQQRWADVYLRGLLSTPGRKTMKRLAGQICGEPSAGQALQQFITVSPWDWHQPRSALARLAARRLPDHAWVAGTFVSEKKGSRSVGVRRRFVPALGATVNCQVGVGLFMVSRTEAIPVDWDLVLDGGWREDAALRRRARIPDTVTGGSAWKRALEMAAGAGSAPWAHRTPLVADLTVTGDLAEVPGGPAFGSGEWLVRVRPDHPVMEHGPGTAPSLPAAPSTAEHVIEAGGTRFRVALSHFDAGSGPVRVRSALVRLPGRRAATLGGHPPVHRLFALDSPGEPGEAQYWLSTLRRRNVGYVFSLIRRQQLVADTLRALEEGYGLTDFEGRSYPGWHHHMTMVSAAYAYRRLTSGPADSLSA